MIKLESLENLAKKAKTSIRDYKRAEDLVSLINSTPMNEHLTSKIIYEILKGDYFTRDKQIMAVCLFYYLCKPLHKDKETLHSDMEEISNNNYTVEQVKDILFKRGNVGSLRIQRYSVLKTSIAEETPLEAKEGENLLDQLEQPAVPEKQQVEVAPSREREVIKAIEKFNNFLSKSNLPPIEYYLDPELKSREEVNVNQDEDDPNYRQEERRLIYFKLLTIEVNPLKDLEWEVAGTKTPISSSGVGLGVEGNVIFLQNKHYKGPPVPKEMQLGSMRCDYCKTNHARTKSVVMHNKKTGEMKEIGRSCLKFYFGNLNLDKFSRSLSDLLDDLKQNPDRESKVVALSLQKIIAATIVAVTEMGHYVSRTTAEKYPGMESTPGKVSFYLYADPKDQKGVERVELIYAREQMNSQELKTQAQEVIQWFRDNESKMESNDFVDKMRQILKFDSINPKLFSFACYLYEMWRKAKGEQGERKEKVEKKPSEFQGQPGEKMERKLLVKRLNSFEGSYGLTYIYGMEDAEGNEFVWFSSNNVLEEHKEYVLKFGIKDHKIWKDKGGNEHKQTVITRVSIVEEKSVESETVIATVIRNETIAYKEGGGTENTPAWTVASYEDKAEILEKILEEKEKIAKEPPVAHTLGQNFPREVFVGRIDKAVLFKDLKGILSKSIKYRKQFVQQSFYYINNDAYAIEKPKAQEIISHIQAVKTS